MRSVGRLAGPSRIAVVIPVGTLESAKSRLGDKLDAEERQDLIDRLLARTVVTALAIEPVADVLVVSPDHDVLRRAADLGARTLRQQSSGLNAGLTEARADAMAGGADAILVLPIDLAFVSPEAVGAVLEPMSRHESVVVLVGDRHGTGTNVLGLRPPLVVEFAFGPNSRNAHREAAGEAGARYEELGGPLAVDIDTPADLVIVESMASEEIGAG